MIILGIATRDLPITLTSMERDFVIGIMHMGECMYMPVNYMIRCQLLMEM